MTKEELKSMIDATIAENGSRSITGKALNLALNAMVDHIGGGVETVYFIPVTEENTAIESAFTEDEINAMVAHNVEVYNKLADEFRNEKRFPPFCVDASMIASSEAGELLCAYGFPLTILATVRNEQSPQSLASVEDFYSPGDLMIEFRFIFFGSEAVGYLLPSGFVFSN